ncbi:MAG: SdpI family protein, partial [Candidatus Hydrogenedentales bacterium]
ILILFAILPRIEPRRQHLQQSRRPYVMIGIGVLVFFLAVHAWLVASALGLRGNTSVFILAMVGALFVLIGFVLGRVKSNFVMGIRTPWTLSSELSWEKTHRLGGILFVSLGVLMLLGSLVVGSEILVPWLVGASLCMVAVLLVYSYIVWRNDPNKQQFGR